MKWMSCVAAGLLAASACGTPAQEAEADAAADRSPDSRENPVVEVNDRQTQAAPLSDEFEEYLRRFRRLEPIYFSLGWRGGLHSKFQLSFKYRLFREDGWAAERVGLLDDLYFGYTQFSLWDLGDESAPFRDTNYKPGMFYEVNTRRRTLDWIDGFGLRAGFEHESNGRDSVDSKSLNILYVRPRLMMGNEEKLYFEIAPKAYVYVGNLGDNADIADYRGYVDLQLRAGYGKGLQVSSTLRRGVEAHYGSVQVDVTYPLRRIFFMDDLGGYLHVQYFNGWGESLLDYNRKLPSQIRVGIMILR